jgi:type IV pilus assembly protein PilA
MFCTRCGTANQDPAQFCAKCGAGFQAAPNAASAPGPAAAPATPGATMPSGWPAPPASPSSYVAPAPAYAGPSEMSGKAIGSLICGIFFFLFPTAILAIVLGHLSLSDIRNAAGRLTGRGLAITGLVLGYAGIASIPLILIIAAIAIPNLLRARMAANEASAVESLRKINAAEVEYDASYQNGYAPNLYALGAEIGNAADCNHAGLIDYELASARKNGYLFIYDVGVPADGSKAVLSQKAAERGCSTPGGPSYSVVAQPLKPGVTGLRSFYSDATDKIRYSAEGTPNAQSEPIN